MSRSCFSKDENIDRLFQLVQSPQSEMITMKNCFQQQQVIHSIREENLQDFRMTQCTNEENHPP